MRAPHRWRPRCYSTGIWSASSRRSLESGDFSDEQVADAIARADYSEPEGHERSVAPPDGPPLQREGGLFRRFRDGFRYDSEA